MNNLDVFLDHLYSDQLEGYIQLMQLNNGKVNIYNADHNNIESIAYTQQKKEDVFITPNTFYIPKRSSENIRQYRTLFIDIDLKKYSKAEAVYQISILADKEIIPLPTMVIDSGRGIHCYWRIKNAPKQAFYTWQELEDYLYYNLKYLGADLSATDCGRLLRLPDTINSRNNSECKIILINNNIYSMYDLREKYLNYKNKSKQQQGNKQQDQDKQNNIKHIFNSYTLHFSRIEDIKTLCKLRNYEVTGYRNKLLYCYTYWNGIYIRDLEQLEDVATDFNNSFSEPLKVSEVKSVVKSTKKAISKFIEYEQGLRSDENKKASKPKHYGYWHKNTTLIEMLDITEEEQRQLRTIISKKEKYRRNNINRNKKRKYGAILTSREQKKMDTIEKVKELDKQGLKQVEIAKELGITQGRVSQILNSY